jgi:ABC-type polysaccharide/polyol phosphate transport system ATPase subunit
VTDPIVEAQRLGLTYRLARNSASSAKEFAIQLVKRQVSYERLRALDDISFSVARGEVFGVVGHNGAGKSTLLKILARVLPPTSGRVVVRGMVAPMIELGAGFQGEMTGRENIVLYGALLGREPHVMRQRAEAIADWAGLDDFLDVPVRSYSTGMVARLGFSVATDAKPDLLIVDEVLSVGDQEFQIRSSARITEMMNAGTSVVLVSHALETVRDLAHRVLWLDHGRAKMLGNAATVVDSYFASS